MTVAGYQSTRGSDRFRGLKSWHEECSSRRHIATRGAESEHPASRRKDFTERARRTIMSQIWKPRGLAVVSTCLSILVVCATASAGRGPGQCTKPGVLRATSTFGFKGHKATFHHTTKGARILTSPGEIAVVTGLRPDVNVKRIGGRTITSVILPTRNQTRVVVAKKEDTPESRHKNQIGFNRLLQSDPSARRALAAAAGVPAAYRNRATLRATIGPPLDAPTPGFTSVRIDTVGATTYTEGRRGDTMLEASYTDASGKACTKQAVGTLLFRQRTALQFQADNR